METQTTYTTQLPELIHEYGTLGITPKKEIKLRALINQQHADSLYNIFNNPRFIIPIGEMDGTEKARLIHGHCIDCKDLKPSEMCKVYQISYSHFRQLRQANERIWNKEHLEYKEEMYFYEVLSALGPDGDNPEFFNLKDAAAIRKLVKAS